MEYCTVFEITQKGFEWSVLVIFLGVPFSILVFWRDLRNPGITSRKLFAIFGMAFFGICGTVAFVGNYHDYEQCKHAYERGDYDVAEGLVHDFQPMPYGGHQNECFAVKETRFCYSDYATYPGFNNAASHGGPIREGLPVRISYIGNDILKIEIAMDARQRGRNH
jgi:hypothetical protein